MMISILGWFGAVIGLLAQWLVSTKRTEVVSGFYVVLNWVSWIGLGGSAIYRGAIASGVFSLFFCIVVSYGWLKARLINNKSSE